MLSCKAFTSRIIYFAPVAYILSHEEGLRTKAKFLLNVLTHLAFSGGGGQEIVISINFTQLQALRLILSGCSLLAWTTT